MGLGYWTRQNTEHCLLGVRGTPQRRDRGVRELVVSERREHSRKPEEFYDLIKRVTEGARVDVFSRERRDGYEQLGNETEKFAEAV